ncbi:MAG: acyloxyacyl hydrolase [Crocinitomicaceae bacterium]|nr:acyloxyacyl hydrolase [Crocinitomicaceae bacterium]
MKFVFFCFTLLFLSSGYTQLAPAYRVYKEVSEKEMWVEGRLKAGFLIAHRSSIGHIPTEHAFAGEASLMFKGVGEKEWHHRYNEPLYGVTGFFGTAGNRELLGHYLGAYGFINFPLITTNPYRLTFKLGSGAGYATKVYDSEDNILSMALSTHLNAMVVLGLDSRFIFGNHTLSLTLDMTHFSNGATKVPNLGLNLPYLSLGYGHKIQESNFCTDCPLADLKKASIQYGVLGIGSVKEMFPVGGRKYGVFGLNLFGRKFFDKRGGVELSLDVVSNQEIIDFKPEVPKTQLEILQMGVYAGYLVPFDKLHIVVGMGAYVKNKYNPYGPLYHRLGFRYMLRNGWNVNIALKSHWARADYIEYGIGYSLFR